ncbi:MAG: L-threonylcarbamoyladenylate synthase [Gaiellaceae bacterium]|jgi:L-threonylcarbamoyladenylate synthase
MGAVEDAVAVLQAGGLVVLPTDTVYGLCASPGEPAAIERINALKGRPDQPIALVAASVQALVERIPELSAWQTPLEEIFPGAYTLVLPNPKRRLSGLSPGRGETIGVRVPELPEQAHELLEQFGAVAATSANRHGEPDPGSVEEIPDEIRAAAGAVLDAGKLPGTPSTVIDVTGSEPVILRAGAGDPERALVVLELL